MPKVSNKGGHGKRLSKQTTTQGATMIQKKTKRTLQEVKELIADEDSSERSYEEDQSVAPNLA